MNRILVGVLMALIIGSFAAVAETITFENTAEGAPPENFDFWRTGGGASGRWAAVGDATAEGGRALEQSSADKTDYRFPLAIYKPLTAKQC